MRRGGGKVHEKRLDCPLCVDGMGGVRLDVIDANVRVQVVAPHTIFEAGTAIGEACTLVRRNEALLIGIILDDIRIPVTKPTQYNIMLLILLCV